MAVAMAAANYNRHPPKSEGITPQVVMATLLWQRALMRSVTQRSPSGRDELLIIACFQSRN